MARAFDAIYPDLAREYGALLYPFFLDGVAADPKLNQRDGLHPTAAGVDVIVANILPAVERLVARRGPEWQIGGDHGIARLNRLHWRHESAHSRLRPFAMCRFRPAMPRLFTALEIPAAVGQSLALLRGGLPGARWVDPENYHLTLRFIGDVDDALAREVAYLLGGIRRPAFDLQLEGLDSFGGNKPRAVVAAAQPVRPLIELQADHERLMQRVGLEPERKYKPHVTLARLRDASSRQVADYLASHQPFRSTPFPVSRFVLYSSRASVGGGPYVVEAEYPLAA